MKALLKPCVILMLGLFVASPLCAYQLALKNGSVVQFQKYRVDGDKVIYVDSAGKEVSVALADVDTEKTKSLNAKETPPLDLTGAAAKSAGTATAVSDEPQSLGDAARAMRQQGKAHATAQKRTFTDDDVSHGAGDGLQPIQAGAKPAQSGAGAQDGKSSGGSTNTSAAQRELTDQQVSEYYDLGREETARAVLAHFKVPPDTPFPDRSEWEARLFEGKKEWIQEYFHAKQHPDDDDAFNRFAAKYNAWVDVVNDGLRRARAYLKEHPQA